MEVGTEVGQTFPVKALSTARASSFGLESINNEVLYI